MALHFVNEISELDGITSDVDAIRSILLLADFLKPSAETIESIVEWLSQVPDQSKKYACFAGKYSEIGHDLCDDLLIARGRDALTTWHDDESIEDTASFFCEAVTYLNTQSLQVVFGLPKNQYEQNLILAIKNRKQ